MEIVISDHAHLEIDRRRLSEEAVRNVAENPQQVVQIRERIVCQSKYFDRETRKEMLLRVICEDVRDTRLVVTAYRTSQVGKYWQPEA